MKNLYIWNKIARFDNKNTCGWLKIQIKFKKHFQKIIQTLFTMEKNKKKEIYQFDLFNMNKTISMWPKI